jgi:glucose/mannose-6-phosphate isomerase
MAVMHGAIPEATHNQVVALDGALAGAGSSDDIFRDPFEDGAGPVRLRLVLLRDLPGEHPQDGRRADVLRDLADRRDVPFEVVASVEGSPVVRLASLVGLADWVSVYAAIASGVDPTPIGPISELKDRIS